MDINRRFLGAIFDPEDWIILFPVLTEGNKADPRWTRLDAADFDAGIKHVERLNVAGYQPFFGPNPRKGPGKNGTEGVALARCHYADFDGGTQPDEALAVIAAAGLPAPTAVLFSGRGTHAYWRMIEPTTDQALWEHRQGWLVAALGSDVAMAKWQQVFRLPGFINRKKEYAAAPPLSRLVVCAPDRQYSWEQIEPKLTPEPVNVVEARKPKAPRKDGEVTPWDDFNRQKNLRDVMPGGWIRRDRRGGKADWSSPENPRRKAAGEWPGDDGPTLYIFDTDVTVLPAGKRLTPFAIYCHLEHGANVAAAVTELRRQGFGKSPEPAIENHGDHVPTLSLEDLRASIGEEMARAMDAPGKVHHFGHGMGVGKTHAAMVTLKERIERAASEAIPDLGSDGTEPAGAPIVGSFRWVVPTHALAREIAVAIHKMGIPAAVMPERKQGVNCTNPDADKADAMGLPVRQAVCHGCKMATGCKYLAEAEAAKKSPYRIGTQELAIRSEKFTAEAEVIVADEDLARLFGPSLTVPIEDVAAVMRWAREVQMGYAVGDRGEVFEPDENSTDFAKTLEMIAADALSAADRIVFTPAGLTVEQLAEAEMMKADAVARKQEDRDHREAVWKSLSEDRARIRQELKAARKSGKGVEYSAGRLADVRQQTKAALSALRSAENGLKREQSKPTERFFRGEPDTVASYVPDGQRVARVNIPTHREAPDDWARSVFYWRQRFGIGRAIPKDALRIVTMAAVGQLIDLNLIEGRSTRDRKNDAGEIVPEEVVKHFLHGRIRSHIPEDVAIIGMDGTTSADELRAATGRDVEEHTPPGRVPLVKPATQYLMDITRKTSLNVVAECVERSARNHPTGPLHLIGLKIHIDRMDKWPLSQSTRARIGKVAHWGEGPDRGSNDWHTRGGTLIGLGTPRVPDVARMEWLIDHGMVEAASEDGDHGPYQWRGVGTNGEPVTVTSVGCRHPAWRTADRAKTGAAMRQGIARARATLPDGIPVDLYSTEPTGMPVAPMPAPDGAAVERVVAVGRGIARWEETAYRVSRENLPIPGWFPTSALVAAMDATRKTVQNGIRAAVEAGRMVKAPKRGWYAVAGEHEPWPTENRAPKMPPAARSPGWPTTDTPEKSTPPRANAEAGIVEIEAPADRRSGIRHPRTVWVPTFPRSAPPAQIAARRIVPRWPLDSTVPMPPSAAHRAERPAAVPFLAIPTTSTVVWVGSG